MIGRRNDEPADLAPSQPSAYDVGDGASAADAAALTLSEERLRVGTTTEEIGSVRARKEVDIETVQQTVPRDVEHAQLETLGVNAGDSGQVETLPDGSLSIPVFEEQIEIVKRLVVRERVVVRKTTVTEQEVVRAEVRKERLEFDTDGDVRVVEESRPQV